MEATNSKHPHIDMMCLPDISQSEMDFYDTSFFRQNPSRQLPTPAFILERQSELDSGIARFEYDHEWRADGWANRLMKQFEDEWFAIAEYSLWRCP